MIRPGSRDSATSPPIRGRVRLGLPSPRRRPPTQPPGGTSTFPVHAALDEPGVECSTGTCTPHDAGYAERFQDLPFVPAAVLLTRVVSHPCPGRLGPQGRRR